MNNKPFILICFFLQTVFCFSQSKPKATVTVPKSIVKPIAQDCQKAILITLNNTFTYGVTLPPKDFGEVQEFKTTSSSTFEGEHNSAWYLLSITRDGELTFDILPQDTTNDYDFLLYAYSDSTFCDQLHENKFKPIRSNLSNIKKAKSGITGLKANTLKNSVGEGVGIAFSKSIDVKKGEKYMLILDNVTPEGKGHTIRFYFMKNVEIKGKIVGTDSLPLVADITLSDNKGNTIEETKSNKQGDYNIKTELIENQNYNLSIVSDSTFVQTAAINTKTLKGTSTFSDIKTILPKLKKGEKYKLGNINFFGNLSTLLPESVPSVEALYKLMKRNKKMIIQIEGHVNDPGTGSTLRFDQTLSEDRAHTIYAYLLSKGIAKERMTSIGLSNTQMLFPHPQNEAQNSANRRVEIKVVSID